MFEANRNGRINGEQADQPGLLAGLLRDAHARMSPSHAAKQIKRYRYYVSRPEPCSDGEEHPIWRMPAGDLEEIVSGKLVQHLRSADAVRGTAMRSSRSAGTRGSVCSRPRSGSPSQRRAELVSLVDHIIVGLDDIQIILRSETKLTARATSVRVGKQVRLALDGPNADGATFQDPALIKLIVRAHQAREAWQPPLPKISSMQQRSKG